MERASQNNNSEGAWSAEITLDKELQPCAAGAARFLHLVEHATEDTRARLRDDQCLAEPCAQVAQLSGAGALRDLSTQNDRKS